MGGLTAFSSTQETKVLHYFHHSCSECLGGLAELFWCCGKNDLANALMFHSIHFIDILRLFDYKEKNPRHIGK